MYQADCSKHTKFHFNTSIDSPTAVATWPRIDATDNVGLVSQLYLTVPQGLANGTDFPVGTTRVTFIASDAYGQESLL